MNDETIKDTQGNTAGVGLGKLRPATHEELDRLPSPSMPEPRGDWSHQIDRIQVAKHPDFFCRVIQAGDAEGNVLTPTWQEMPKNSPIPPEACLPISEAATQSLFDSLWRQGYRPTGTQVTMEVVPEPEAGTYTEEHS